MGDGILAFFGAPITHDGDAERACRVAVDIIPGSQQYARQCVLCNQQRNQAHGGPMEEVIIQPQ